MKLLFCDRCWDVFKLGMNLRECNCGAVKGKYINNEEAVVNGEGYSLAIGNGSLIQGIRKSLEIDAPRSEFITKAGMIAWARPHSGPGNPHTTVDPQLGNHEL